MSYLTQSRRFLCLGTLLGFIAVLLGAFGFHALKGQLTEAAINQYRIGVEYQFYHVSVILIGALAFDKAAQPKWLIRSLSGFVVGIILFSGNLFLMAVTGSKLFGFVTPLGGVVLVFSWLAFILAFTLEKSVEPPLTDVLSLQSIELKGETPWSPKINPFTQRVR